MIPYGRQTIDQQDLEAVVAVLRSDWLTQGPAVEEFEAALVAATGAEHAVAFANGTAALHGACAAAGLGPGDVVATSALTFSASAACARYVGADLRFLDVDPATWNIDPEGVPTGVDALVAVDFAGLPVDLARLTHRPRVVIEDASHALGGRTPDGPVGCCAHSDMTTFSFHPVKVVTAAEGGAVTTNDPALAERLRRFRSHGVVRPDPARPWFYDVAELGFNYRLSDLHAALGTSQLQRLPAFVERRNELADRYRELLRDLAVGLPPRAPEGWRHGQHLFPITTGERDTVVASLRARGIGAQVHYRPLHLHTAYADVARPPGGLPEAERLGARLLSLPLYPTLTPEEQDHVVEVLTEVIP